MQSRPDDNVDRQYSRPAPLNVRIKTHRLYSERELDLDSESATLLCLTGDEALLDVGCGPGHFLRYLRRKGHRGRLVGLDQSEGMIRAALDSADSEGHEIEALVGDACELPFDDNAVDWAAARHMLYHVDDIGRAIQELRRVAGVGMLLTTNSARSKPFVSLLLEGVLAKYGFRFTRQLMERFSTENTGAILEQLGLTFREVVFDNTLIFTDPAPLAAYVMSSLPSYDVPNDPELLSAMENWLHAQAREGIERTSGTLREPTRVGMYLVMRG